jgi:hypothetical protein
MPPGGSAFESERDRPKRREGSGVAILAGNPRHVIATLPTGRGAPTSR